VRLNGGMHSLMKLFEVRGSDKDSGGSLVNGGPEGSQRNMDSALERTAGFASSVRTV
jgi:hypothetical protein